MSHLSPIRLGALVASAAAALPAGAEPLGGDFDSSVFTANVLQVVNKGATPLIAGKSTMVRAVIFTTGTVPPGTEIDGVMRVYVDGVEAPDSPVYSVNGPWVPNLTPDPEVLDDTLNFSYLPPESGDVVFEIEINPAGPGQVPESNFDNNVFTTGSLAFECRRNPEIVYVPVDYQPSGSTGTNLPDPFLIEPGVGDGFVQAIYPSPDWEYRPYDAGTKLWTGSLSGTGSALNAEMASELALMVPTPDFIYSWINGGLPYNGQAIGIPGVAAMGNTQPIRHQRTFAHELGHLFGESHISATIQTIGVDVEHHLDITEGIPQLHGFAKNDIMVAGLLTQEAWQWPENYIDYNADFQFSCSLAATAELEQGLLISGLWNQETGELEVLDSLSFPRGVPTASLPAEQADLVVRTQLAGGAEVQTGFTANLAGDCAQPAAAEGDESADSEGGVLPIAGFSYVLPHEASAIERVAIVEARTGETLATLERSASAPELSLVSPRPYDYLPAGPFLLEWEASDADGDDLRYYVRYSHDGEHVFPLAMGITDDELLVDPTKLARLETNAGWFEVLATDGLNTTSVRTVGVVGTTFSSAGGQAPTTYILTPDDGKSFAFGSTVFLHSSGWDLEDRAITGDDVVWTSDLDGPIGTGRLTSVADLSVGTHVITVQVSDTGGQVATDTSTITITPRDLPGGEEVCQPDLGFAGPGSSVLSVCGNDLGSGGTAIVSLTGATPGAVSWLAYGPVSNPIPLFDGTLVPNPPNLRMQMTDGDGSWSFPINGGGGPNSIYAQAVTVDPSQPQGYEFSNAVELQFLP